MLCCRDHHDAFSSVLEEVMSVKGKASWSGPHNWAYLDMVSPAALADNVRRQTGCVGHR